LLTNFSKASKIGILGLSGIYKQKGGMTTQLQGLETYAEE
jgi:hypothetical protein